jgi:hypothetical protein
VPRWRGVWTLTIIVLSAVLPGGGALVLAEAARQFARGREETKIV